MTRENEKWKIIHSKELAKCIKIFDFAWKKLHALEGQNFWSQYSSMELQCQKQHHYNQQPHVGVEAKEPQLSALYWLFLCIYTWRWRIALRPSALSPAHFEALSAARAATGGPVTIHESLHEFSFDIFQLDPKYYSPALYLKCHTEQQIAQRLLQAVLVTDNLLFGL